MVVMSTISEIVKHIDVSFLIVGSTRTSNGDVLADHNSIVNQLIQIAENRKDCMVDCITKKVSVVNVASESAQSTNVVADYCFSDFKFLCSSRFRLGIFNTTDTTTNTVGCLATDIQQVLWQGLTY